MSIYSNVTEQDSTNLRKLAERQKNQRAEKIKKRKLKQTHDVELAQSLSPITKRLDEVKESTEKLGDVIKGSQPKTPQLAIANTLQPAIEKIEGVLYDVELENILNKMKDNTGFFKASHDPQRGGMINNYPIKMVGGTKAEIKDNAYNISSGLQRVFTNKSYDTANLMNDMEKVIFRDILQKTKYKNRKRRRGPMSGRDRYIQKKLDDDVRKILNLDRQLKGRGVEKNIIPSNIIDIYTRQEVLLG